MGTILQVYLMESCAKTYHETEIAERQLANTRGRNTTEETCKKKLSRRFARVFRIWLKYASIPNFN